MVTHLDLVSNDSFIDKKDDIAYISWGIIVSGPMFRARMVDIGYYEFREEKDHFWDASNLDLLNKSRKNDIDEIIN